MSNPQPEPSMEEILASIRRIISDDEEDTGSGSEASSSPAAEAAPKEAIPASAPKIPSVEEITSAAPQRDEAKPHLKTEEVEMIKNNVAAAVQDETETMLDQDSAAVASEAFSNLSQTVRMSKSEGRTLEDIVVDILKPMVKSWLDENLPEIVEQKVEEEVQRVSRRRG